MHFLVPILRASNYRERHPLDRVPARVAVTAPARGLASVRHGRMRGLGGRRANLGGLLASMALAAVLMHPLAAARAAEPAGAAVTTSKPTVTNDANEVSNESKAGAGVVRMEALDNEHRIAAGDRLSFRIIEDHEEMKTLLVKDSGQVEVPYIGLFPAVTKTCRQLARELKLELEKDYYYQATVIIAVDQLSRSRGRVYLVGCVQSPGPQEIPSDEVFTVSKLIMRAGGFRDFADKRRVRITRGGGDEGSDSRRIIVDVADVIERGHVEKDVELQVGDVVFVPTRLVNF